MFNSPVGQTRTKDADIGLGIKQWQEKREPDQVVAVAMSNEQGDVERFAMLALQQLATEANDAAACIQDKGMRTGLYFNTSGVPAVT